MTQLPTTQLSPPEAAAQAEQEATNAQVAAATGILAIGNVLSRILGLARETLLTYLFGASGAVDAFQVAIIVPRGIYDLLIGGHINSAIVPILSEIITLKGRDEFWRAASLMATIVSTLLALLVIVIQLLAPQLVRLVAGGAPPHIIALAAHLLRLTAPALLFMGLFAVYSGALYALRRFTWPALAGVFFNGSIVLVTVLFAPPLQWQIAWDGGAPLYYLARPQESIAVVALGWLAGAVVQFAIQLPGARGGRFHLWFNWRHPILRRTALLYAPVMFSLVMDTLIIRPFSYNLASQTGEGSIAYMNWATTLIQFPQGLVATAISIAILPTLSAQAALSLPESQRAFKDTLGLGLRLATSLILPAAAGLFVLATPIIQLLFEHGAFTPADTYITAVATRLYLLGLPFAALDLLLVYAFYARKDTLTPALVGILSLVVYMIIALALLRPLGLFSLMIADSVKHAVHALLSAYLLRRLLGGFGRQQLGMTVVKASLGASIMGLVAHATLPLLMTYLGGPHILQEAIVVLASAIIYGGLFLALAMVLRLEELQGLVALVRRKLSRSVH